MSKTANPKAVARAGHQSMAFQSFVIEASLVIRISSFVIEHLAVQGKIA